MIGVIPVLLLFNGAPIPKANLLANGDFSRDTAGFRSGYTYRGNLGADGCYFVGNNPQLEHSGGTKMGDHTTGTGGMLIANGSQTPDTTVWEQTVRLVKGHRYALSLWSASWGRSVDGNPNVDPHPARLMVTANGKPIGSPFALDARNGIWKPFRASWMATTTSPVTIRIVDENTEWYGNDFAIDDLALVGP